MSETCRMQSMPPIGEMNHGIGNCYCHLCTCGEHKCPGDYLKNQKYLPSALRSQYKKEYTKKQRIASQPQLRDTRFTSEHNKMDLKTISQQDFVQHEAEKVSSARYDKGDNSGVLKFTGVSQYASEFPNWGHYEFIHIRNFRAPFSNSNVKLESATTYSQNFGKSYEKFPVTERRKIAISNPLTLGSTHFPKTTSEETFKAFQKHHFPERAENKAFGILALTASPQTYRSTYNTEFIVKSPPVIVPKKRYSILSPGKKL